MLDPSSPFGQAPLSPSGQLFPLPFRPFLNGAVLPIVLSQQTSGALTWDRKNPTRREMEAKVAACVSCRARCAFFSLSSCCVEDRFCVSIWLNFSAEALCISSNLLTMSSNCFRNETLSSLSTLTYHKRHHYTYGTRCSTSMLYLQLQLRSTCKISRRSLGHLHRMSFCLAKSSLFAGLQLSFKVAACGLLLLEQQAELFFGI